MFSTNPETRDEKPLYKLPYSFEEHIIEQDVFIMRAIDCRTQLP